MFEAQVAYYLNKYLGKYVEGIDQQSLTISIYAGNVVLKNLQLKASALADLDLPLTVKSGLLGTLTLKVPWNALGRMPVEVTIDRLYILAAPKTDKTEALAREEGPASQEPSLADVDAAYQAAKLERVGRQEAHWVDELEHLEARKQHAGGSDGGEGGGFLRGLIDTIVGNLQLSISNVHVRYEDDVTHSGHPFACGLTLEKVSGYTINEAGQEAFVTNNPLEMLRKALQLRRVAVYFDCDAAAWDPGAPWASLAPEDWEGWFQPGVAAKNPLLSSAAVGAAGSAAATASGRQYVLQPVDGRATYIRRGRNVKRSEDEPAAEFDFTLDVVALALSRAQYESYSLLLAEVAVFTARLPHSGYRPRHRPAPGRPARAWWRYAALAVKQQRQAHKLTLVQAVQYAGMQRQYVPMYVHHIKAQPVGGPKAGGGAQPGGATTAPVPQIAGGLPSATAAPQDPSSELHAMDSELPENTILMFRRLAYAEVQRERRREAKAAAAAGQARKASSGGGGWLSWLKGSGAAVQQEQGGAAAAAEGAGAGEEAASEQRADLTSEEYNRLIELVSEQEQGLKLGMETPHTLLMQVRVHVGSASAVLRGPDGRAVLRGSLEGIAAAMDKYPVTARLQLSVTAMGVESPEGVFIRTGAQPSSMKPTLDRSSSMTAEMRDVTSDQALAVSFIQRPQDNSADAVLDVVLTPSYVYYSAATVARVIAFFTPPQELRALDFSGLSAAATTQLERARRAAAEYAAAALSNKPRLRMRLALDAPKVAVPVDDAHGQVTLALDLGRFVIESDHATASKLPPEEAGLYECVRLQGSNVSAYVADGAFDWQQLEGNGSGAGSNPAAATMVPLLERCGMDVGLQAARYPEPRFPRLRLTPCIPVLHFYVSPGRIGRLLRVLYGALPGGGGGEAGGPAAEQQALEGDAWRQLADLQGALRVLTWTGIGRSTAAWCPRYGVIYKGKLHVYESDACEKLASTVSLWPDRRVVRLPADAIGGCTHVLAVCPLDADLQRAAEDPSCAVLRFDSVESENEWYRSLLAAQQSMQDLAGEIPGGVPPADWDATSSSMSASDVEEIPSTPAAPGATSAGQPTGPSALLQIEAQLGEFAVFLSGRAPDVWWPPDASPPPQQPTQDLSATALTPFIEKKQGPGSAAGVDGEVALVVVRASGGSMGFAYGAFGLTLHTALGALEVEDQLVGHRSPDHCFLATSTKPSAGGVEVGDEMFFDPVASGDLSRSVSGVSGPGSGGTSPRTLPSPRKASGSTPQLQRDLAEFVLKLRRPGTREYEGVDTSFEVSFNTLFFFCNRPTVAALISMGLDVSTATAVAAPAAHGSTSEATPAAEGGATAAEQASSALATAAAADQGAMAAQHEEVAGLQLLGSTQGRTMFALSITLHTLQVALNYEGAQGGAVSEACMNDFSFSLAIAPDGGMEITSALGNMTATDCTLPEDHPYRQPCGLRPGSSNSLVALSFAFHPNHHQDPRVPPGLAYYTLQAKLSELQLVFLYRYLQENLQYLYTMLAMRPPPLQGSQSPPPQQPQRQEALPTTPKQGAGRAEAGAAQEAQQPEPLQQQPFVLVMDVAMDAPVICMPRHTDSSDAIESDLGELHLRSRVISEPLPAQQQGNDKAPAAPAWGSGLLVEVADLTFSGLSCRVVQAGRRGHSVVRNPEQGWQLQWRRPLQPDLRGEAPTFDLSIFVPYMRATVSDAEYLLMSSVASANVAEEPSLPKGAEWLRQHYLRAAETESVSEAPAELQQQQQLGAPAQLDQAFAALELGGVQEAGRIQEDVRLHEAGVPEIEALPGPAPASEDASPTRIRTVISLGEVELEMQRTVEGLPQPLPLARFAVANLYVEFRNTEEGSMHVGVCVPRVEVQDLRSEVPLEQSLVVSSGHKASFLMLDWAAGPEMAHQVLAVTLQKPLLVAELSFLLAVTQFVVPTFSFVKSSPIPYASHDLLLTEEPHLASSDLWLSPSVRLLADRPNVTAMEYDGQGRKLVLPARSQLDELLPLIIVGPSRTLRLRNVTIINADSLPACVQLAAGGRLLTSAGDGVKLVNAGDAAAAAEGGMASPRSGGGGSTQLGQSSPTPPTRLSRLAGAGEGDQAAFSEGPSQPQQAQQAPRFMEIKLSAVDLGLQLMQLDKGPGHSSRPSSAAGSAAISRSGSQHPSTAEQSMEAQAMHRAASAAGTAALRASAAPLQRSVHLLAAHMDLDAAYRSQGYSQTGHVCVQGLRVETRSIDDAAAMLHDRAAEELQEHRKVKGRTETVVLDPCRITLDFDLLSAPEEGHSSAAGAPPAQVVRTDLKLDASDLRVTLSPGALALAASLGAGALAPLAQPGPDHSVRAVSQFELVWSFDPAAGWQDASELAVSVAATGGGGGVTVWRPLVATGYGLTGFVLTPGDAKPTFEVLSVAVNSGLGSYPSSYTKLWSGGGACIWRAHPPKDYVAVGDILTLGDQEPELSDMLCLHESTLVEVPVGQCLPLPPALPHTPAAAVIAAEALPPVDLWCVDNTLGTFLASTPTTLAQVKGRDLRNPLGVTPAGLMAVAAAEFAAEALPSRTRTRSTGQLKDLQEQQQAEGLRSGAYVPKLKLTSSPRHLYEAFTASRRQKRTEEVQRTLTPQVVDFRRIWSDGGAFSKGEGITAWRPVAPPGFAALGDSLVKGFDPPTSALVVLDSGAGGGAGLGQAKGMPLAKAPRGHELVWTDGNPRSELRACIWRPVPHPGYVSMGCVVTIGETPPKRGSKCLRVDAAAPAPLPRAPMWAVRRASKTLPPITVWSIDERLGTFVAVGSEAASPPEERWRLRVPELTSTARGGRTRQTDQLQQQAAAQQGLGVNVLVRTGATSVLLRDALNTPLLEIDSAGVEAGVRGPSRQVLQAYLGVRLGVWAYNGSGRHWEPVLEPVDIIAKCDANTGARTASGIEPGITVSVKSSAEMVYSTLAFAHVSALLAAHAAWKGMQERQATGGPRLVMFPGTDGSVLHTTVENRLGVGAAMELDCGNHMEVVSIPAGEEAPVLRPLPQFPARRDQGFLPRDALPHDLILLDVDTATGAALVGRQLYCTMRLEGSGVDRTVPPGSAAPSRTRAGTASEQGQVSWHERLVAALPSRPAEHHTAVFEVWDAAARGGKGALIGRASVQAATRDIREKDAQPLEVAVMGMAGSGEDTMLCMLRGSYMLQHQWSVRTADASPGDGWEGRQSSAGERAISIASKPGSWVVIPGFGQQRAAAAALAKAERDAASSPAALVSTLTALQIEGEGVVVQGRMEGAEWREQLRSLCQVVNSTEFALEVRLVTMEDGDWQEAVPDKSATAEVSAVLDLGVAQPGECLPLPLGWQQPGQQLLIRPVIAGGEQPGNGDAAHEFSVGLLRGQHTLKLDELEEGQTRLVACPSLMPSSSSASGSGLVSATLWLSVSVDADILTAGKQADPVLDWRIVVAPPVTLTNQLPMPGSLMVWEARRGSKDLVERFSERVPSGGKVGIYTADMRRAVSFTLYPDGYDWAEAAPAVLSHGMTDARAAPPDRCRLVRPGSRLPVEVFIRREFELGPWVLGAADHLDPGAVGAVQGVPLSVTLLAPLWVVNATGLAIDAAVVQVPPPPPAVKREERGPQAQTQQLQVASVAPREALRVLQTSDRPGSSADQPTGPRTIAPSSMELLSFPLPSFMAGTSSANLASSAGGSGASSSDAKQRAKRQYYGVRLRIAGSGWTQPLALDVVDVASSGQSGGQGQVNNLQNAQPVLIQAESREAGVIFEVAARLDVTTFKTSQVLRLEPHVVVSNRSAVPLQLLQCRAAAMVQGGGDASSAAAAVAAQTGATVIIPEGGMPFAHGTSRGINAMPVTLGGPPLMRPTLRSIASKKGASSKFDDDMWGGAGQYEEEEEVTSHPIGTPPGQLLPKTASPKLSRAVPVSRSPDWNLMPAALSSSALVQLSSNAQRVQQDRGAVLELAAGASAVPLHLPAGLSKHVLCFRHSAAQGSGGAAEVFPLWSRPQAISYDKEEAFFLVIPVAPDAAGGTAIEPSPTAALGAGGVAVLRASVLSRGPGGVHLVLESVNSDAPFLLENRTPFPLQYRQAHVRAAPFHTLPPWSAAGYVWEYSLGGSAPLELEMQEGAAVGASEFYALEAPEGGDTAGGGTRARPLPISAAPRQCTVRVGFAETVAMGQAGVLPIGGDAGGGVLGRGGADRLLQVAPGRDNLLVAGLKGIAAPPPDVLTTFELPGLEVSLVDEAPQEILLLTVNALKVVAASGVTPVGPYSSLRFTVQRLQVDDQLPGTRFPVVLSPARHTSVTLPMLGFTMVSQKAGARGRTFFPYIGGRCPADLQLALWEPLIWRLAALGTQLTQAAAAAGAAGAPATTAVDVAVRIRLLAVGSLGLEMSFQGDPLSRPRHMSGGMVSMVIDLANFQAAPIVLRGFDMANVATLRSAFATQMMGILRGQLFNVGLALVRNFGVIGGASKVLGILSAGVAKLAGEGTAQEGPSHAAPTAQNSQRAIADVGDGLLEGAGAFGTSIFRGFKGLVEKPVAGAKRTGVHGAVKGMAQGLVGVFTAPVSGALDALSATAEGFDATFGKSRQEVLVLERRRLPRVVGGDGRLMPLQRDGSSKEAIIEGLGQALLRATLLATPGAAPAARLAIGAALEAYEEHFVLPGDGVALLTNRSIMLLSAPGFAQLDGAAEVGAPVSVDVPPGQILWSVRWDDLLALELRWSAADHYPDRVVVHRRGRGPGSTDTMPLARLLRCFPGTPQASQVKLVATKVLRRYYQDPARQDAAWSERHAARAALPADVPPHDLPLTMPSLDFEMTWHTNPSRTPVVVFWRAVPPPGYKPAGDVATLGMEAPLHPVPCFRDDATLQSAHSAVALSRPGSTFSAAAGASRRSSAGWELPPPGAADASAAATTCSGNADEPPPTAHPQEFSLLWRYNGQRSVTMWMPVAPPGYVALGAVVLGSADVPGVDDYLCVREDLTAPARVFDSPIWSYDPAPGLAAAASAVRRSRSQTLSRAPNGVGGASTVPLVPEHQPEAWKVAVWPVDNRLGTVLVVRALSKPPPGVARTVTVVEAGLSRRGGGVLA